MAVGVKHFLKYRNINITKGTMNFRYTMNF